MTLTFAESTDLPTRVGGPGRPKTPNPYIDTLRALDARRQENDKLNLKAVVADEKEATRAKNLLQDAGAEIDRTVRVVVDKQDDGTYLLTTWTIPRIKHAEKTPEEKEAINAKRRATLEARKAQSAPEVPAQPAKKTPAKK